MSRRLCCASLIIMVCSRPLLAQAQTRTIGSLDSPPFEQLTELVGGVSWFNPALPIVPAAVVPKISPSTFPFTQGLRPNEPLGGYVALFVAEFGDPACLATGDCGAPIEWSYFVHVDAPGAQILDLGGAIDTCGLVVTDDFGLGYRSGLLPPHYRLQYSTPGVKSITATAYFCKDGVPSLLAGQTTLSFRVSGDEVVVRAGLGSGPGDSSTQTAKVGQTSLSATVPLGSKFFVQLATKDLKGIQSSFTLQAANINPPLKEPSLFPNNAVIAFDAGAQGDTKYFQAVHLGDQLLAISSQDPSFPSVTALVKIVVNRPASLGKSQGQFDALLIDVGHQRGIPPQFLKGQVQEESRFRPEAFRYEPLNVDLAFVSRGKNIRTVSPYADYRLATNDPLPQGTKLVNADITPREKYFIVVNGQPQPITSTDTLVSARAIYNANNRAGAKEFWSVLNKKAAGSVKKNPSLLDFTAQTPIASSYGLLQILYSTAIAPVGWEGIDGAKNPSFLFDINDYNKKGGGSVSVGSRRVRQVFSRANAGSVSVDNPVFQSSLAFNTAFFRFFTDLSTTPGSEESAPDLLMIESVGPWPI